MQWVVLFLFVTLLSSGCASRKGRAGSTSAQESTTTTTRDENSKHSKPAIVTPATGTIGRVTAANARARFVVITYPIGVMPSLEQRLNAYRNGLKVAELKVTGPTRDTHTVADILAGECQVGDEVREN